MSVGGGRVKARSCAASRASTEVVVVILVPPSAAVVTVEVVIVLVTRFAPRSVTIVVLEEVAERLEVGAYPGHMCTISLRARLAAGGGATTSRTILKTSGRPSTSTRSLYVPEQSEAPSCEARYACAKAAEPLRAVAALARPPMSVLLPVAQPAGLPTRFTLRKTLPA